MPIRPLSALVATNKDAFLNEVARAGEINFKLPGSEVHGSERIIRWEAAAHDTHDEGEIGAKRRVHETCERLGVFRHSETVIDAWELYVCLEQDLTMA